MSKSNSKPRGERFHFPNSRELWHDGAAFTESLGCQGCAFREDCGGLQIEAAVFDCMTFCRCSDPTCCDNVCPNNTEHMVARIQEVRGFGFHNIPPAPVLTGPKIPAVVPMIYHRTARARTLQAPFVALSLYELFNKRDGQVRFKDREALLNRFLLHRDSSIILSGTEQDPALERWWSLGSRSSIVRRLSELGVTMMTAPNFSLFNEVPRLDNMFNMKRIAITWSEVQREGMRCALHLNARTNRDWERWAQFLNQHVEIEDVAFEFGTGAGFRQRMPWHVAQLCNLARYVARPLHLFVRGGLMELPFLRSAFANVTFIDTTAFVKAQRRRRAVIQNGRLTWQIALTDADAPIDDILDANIEAMKLVAGSAPTRLSIAS